MKIVGCDLHTRYQEVAMLDDETGELVERRLERESGEARTFYAALTIPVRVGVEATGYTRWFERMLRELGHELWIGDAAQIRAAMVRYWMLRSQVGYPENVRIESSPRVPLVGAS
jgi:transposase